MASINPRDFWLHFDTQYPAVLSTPDAKDHIASNVYAFLTDPADLYVPISRHLAYAEGTSIKHLVAHKFLEELSKSDETAQKVNFLTLDRFQLHDSGEDIELISSIVRRLTSLSCVGLFHDDKTLLYTNGEIKQKWSAIGNALPNFSLKEIHFSRPLGLSIEECVTTLFQQVFYQCETVVIYDNRSYEDDSVLESSLPSLLEKCPLLEKDNVLLTELPSPPPTAW